MSPRSIAIACQGGGIHGAFTCGVLSEILQAKIDLGAPGGKSGTKRDFDICGLSGTSAGALNAFMVWYGLMRKAGEDGSHGEALDCVNTLWDVFQARKLGERSLNSFARLAFKMSGLGLGVRSVAPPVTYDWLMTTLRTWSRAENAILPELDFGEIRPEFFDFQALLRACAPDLDAVEPPLPMAGPDRAKPRLLIGAVEILSGAFEVFDSFAKREAPNLDHRTAAEALRTISYDAVAASGTLPEIKRAQAIPGLKTADGRDVRYWDGLYSQNPPVREFFADTAPEDKPDELWVIRINPQTRDHEPTLLGDIEDRRNELAGNLSLNQELRMLDTVNRWMKAHPQAFPGKKPVDIAMITMAKSWSDRLDVASKFDRDPAFVEDLRAHGRERGRDFIRRWLGTAGKGDKVRAWPEDALAA